ncbi:MAG: glycosyltransferase family 2 protein [Methylococcaceae bacterium]|jgi:glycosyltransferase involved in cell wall biosynthesis
MAHTLTNAPTFTIFIPTYNRADLLPRTFASIDTQTFRDFEVVIIDDGSTDGTADLVAQWRSRADFGITYERQSNQGKYVACNRGVQLARGQFFVLLDSDDRLLPHCLERLLYHWETIPKSDRHRFAGIEGLVEGMDGQPLATTHYPESPLDADYLDLWYRRHIGGEKRGAMLTSVLREYPYPIFPGERHIRDSITWKRIALRYVVRCVNEVFQQMEQQADGLTSNRFAARMNSPRGFQLFYLEDVTLYRSWLSLRQFRRSMIDFIRFSLHCDDGFLAQARLVEWAPAWLLLLPAGVARWLVDLYRLRFKGGHHPNKVKLLK